MTTTTPQLEHATMMYVVLSTVIIVCLGGVLLGCVQELLLARRPWWLPGGRDRSKRAKGTHGRK